MQTAKVRARPELLRNAIDEILRLSSPANSMWRVVKQDTELGGVQIPANSMVLLRFGSGNRDESKFADPDTFDVERKNAQMHLAFGRGVHACLGSILSRKEMQVSFRRIFARMNSLQLESDGNIEYHHNLLLRGLKTLQIRFDKA